MMDQIINSTLVKYNFYLIKFTYIQKKSHTHKQCSDKVAFYALCVDIMCRHYVYTLNSLNELSDMRRKKSTYMNASF